MVKEKAEHKDYFSIRPAGRHILTIGSDLIQNPASAIIELIKNAYDADAKSAEIIFTTVKPKQKATQQGIRIVIKDDGHGMSFNDIKDKWLVPSTKYKQEMRESPNGRIMQGRKGIGRFAASILGDEFFLETITEDGQKSTLFINWNDFKNAEYLDEVPVLVETGLTSLPHGTRIEITGDETKLAEWKDKKEIDNLINELRKLISPIREKEEDDFSIIIQFKDFPVKEYSNIKIEIEPYPLIELYDYRLFGKIEEINVKDINLRDIDGSVNIIRAFGSASKGEEGKIIVAELTYENATEKTEEKFSRAIRLPQGNKYCGKIILDFRVFDRDPESIELLIKRGLKDPQTGQYLGKREARKLLDKFNGISIFRGDFRIRPYGDPGYDWLELDKRRVQNPSFCIGSNQIIGYIKIQSEEESHLKEKSARDGLKEDGYYKGLKNIALQALSELEQRRFDFRKRTGRGRKLLKIEEELEKVFDFTFVERKILEKLKKEKIGKESLEDISRILREEEGRKNKLLKNIKEIIALYQGQATLGKIIMVIQHEGRKPLAWFKNQMPYFKKYAEKLLEKFDPDDYAILQKISSGSIAQTNILIDLFDRLDPLTVKKRGRKKDFSISDAIIDSYRVFETELKRQEISFIIQCDDDFSIKGWKEDILTAFTNLIDNSIYWMSRFGGDEIIVECYRENGKIIVDYFNNGPPIEKELIEKGLIFEPGFSKKIDDIGTGIGLPIAGEALARNSGKLKAIYSENGAYFRIELEVEK